MTRDKRTLLYLFLNPVLLSVLRCSRRLRRKAFLLSEKHFLVSTEHLESHLGNFDYSDSTACHAASTASVTCFSTSSNDPVTIAPAAAL